MTSLERKIIRRAMGGQAPLLLRRAPCADVAATKASECNCKHAHRVFSLSNPKPML